MIYQITSDISQLISTEILMHIIIFCRSFKLVARGVQSATNLASLIEKPWVSSVSLVFYETFFSMPLDQVLHTSLRACKFRLLTGYGQLCSRTVGVSGITLFVKKARFFGILSHGDQTGCSKTQIMSVSRCRYSLDHA
jgi:hypothetical protein